MVRQNKVQDYVGRKKIDSLFTVDIQKWGSGTNDCMWRVAKSAAGEGASSAEVNEKLGEIAELNNAK